LTTIKYSTAPPSLPMRTLAGDEATPVIKKGRLVWRSWERCPVVTRGGGGIFYEVVEGVARKHDEVFAVGVFFATR